MTNRASRRSCRLILLGGVLTALVATAVAHEGDHETAQYFRERMAGIELDVDSPATTDTLVTLVGIAADAQTQFGIPLLPPGTLVDRAEWHDDVLELDLTLGKIPQEGPIAHPWRISEIDAETISRAMISPFLCDPRCAGVRIAVREAGEAGYVSLAAYLYTKPVDPEEPSDPIDVHGIPNNFGESALASGPTANATRQPTGALSGVTVYIAAGHGWTAGASSWFLQRPVLLGMCEDYGNIDQLNYFAAYLFNAGATVVPLRPLGWQPIEIVLDQDDPGVTYTGSWSNSGNPKYYENGVTNSGVAYRFANTAASQSATARYAPTITTAGFYPVYTFVITSSNRVPQRYRISHTGGISEVLVDHREVGNGWVWLGNYYFSAGSSHYVEISNQSPISGVVIADAIRFGGGTGTVSRPGPGSTSGYPRDEEGQRYWAHGELGQTAVGFSSTIWDGAGDDLSDNVGAGARLAAEMNVVPAGGVQVDRWKRVYLEFHTNAFNQTSRGQLCLITDLGATTNQNAFALTLSNEIDNDMLILSSQFEHAWVDRASATLTGSYGAIATVNNGNEFDATLVELAFHDNAQDAELLRDPRVRDAMGRSCVHGIIRFLNTLPGSAVPLAFAPHTPRSPRVIDQGGGNVLVSWTAPLADGARGDAATGYVIYQSTDGYGFGDPIVLGNVTSHTLTGVPTGQTRYLRIAATNAGGESMPTEVLAVRRPTSGTADILIVNGFDRLRRQTNPVQTFTQPPAYSGDSIERQIWLRSNAFNYVVQHAEALAANGHGFASCSNEAIIDLVVTLTNFNVVVWILGNESSADQTLSAGEQAALNTYLAGGRGLFISGAEIAFDLIGQSAGVTFATTKLKIGYGADNANTSNVTPTAGGIFNGLAAFSFDEASGAPYRVPTPDVLTLQSGAVAALNYVGGAGGIAAVQQVGPSFNTVTFGFPFEAIGSSASRAAVMQRIIPFLRSAAASLPFDQNNDGDVDFADAQLAFFCLRGPGTTYPPGNFCRTKCDQDGDADVDMHDIRVLQQVFTGPLVP
ncbi:MAG: N-acetylmuramoyl-L-alanine amidase [Planctomycetia bacterium]|nr:MAG: N-acetylmuramoyl-L-alanine amidase [Planctomycetia bacterium]